MKILETNSHEHVAREREKREKREKDTEEAREHRNECTHLNQIGAREQKREQEFYLSL